MNRASRVYGTISKSLIFVLSLSQKERKSAVQKKIVEDVIDENPQIWQKKPYWLEELGKSQTEYTQRNPGPDSS